MEFDASISGGIGELREDGTASSEFGVETAAVCSFDRLGGDNKVHESYFELIEAGYLGSDREHRLFLQRLRCIVSTLYADD